MTQGTNQIEQFIGRYFGVRGFVAHAIEVGPYEAASDFDDMTDSQATLAQLCAKDPRMQAKSIEVLALIETIEEENNVSKARPWFDLAEYLASLA